MSTDEPVFEFKEVRAIRGLAEKTRSKWEKEGWEFVSQSEGKLQTTLNFRRPKPNFPVKWVVIGGVVAALLVTIIVIGTISEANNKSTATKTPTTTNSAATSSSTATQTPTPSETEEEILTVQKNADLAALLASNGEDLALNEAFFEKYGNALIEFDGNIAYMAPHGDYTTRYDALIQSGDYSETKSFGPPFRVIDVNYYDFHLTGPNEPDSVSQRDNIRVIGRITGWKDPAFTMEIVSTRIR